MWAHQRHLGAPAELAQLFPEVLAARRPRFCGEQELVGLLPVGQGEQGRAQTEGHLESARRVLRLALRDPQDAPLRVHIASDPSAHLPLPQPQVQHQQERQRISVARRCLRVQPASRPALLSIPGRSL